MSRRISSGIAITGWVSLSWIATRSGICVIGMPSMSATRMRSASAQAVKKYCWRRRSSLPAGVESSG